MKSVFLEILKDKYHLFKTIVICNNDEITNLNKWLVRNGIEVMALSDKSTKEEIEHCEEEWGYLRGGQYKGNYSNYNRPITIFVFGGLFKFNFKYFSFVVYGFHF